MTLKWATSTDQLYALGNTQPSLDCDFASNKNLTDHITARSIVDHQRDMSAVNASPGTYVDSEGLIKTSPVNLLTFSEQFDQWTVAANSIITPNVTAAPDGTFTADQVYFEASGDTNVSQSTTLTQNQTYTFSVYAKAATPGTNNKFIPYINSPNPKFPNDFEATSEWQRFTFTFTHTNPTASTGVFLLNRSDAYITNVYFWGAQLEEGDTATDYIPTTDLPSAAPRFDHDPVTGESLGLLLEEERTNLQVPSIPAISAVAITVTVNAAVAPDGTTTATFCEPDNVASGIRSNSTFAKNAGEFYTHTFFFKPNGYNVAGIDYGSGNPDSYAETWIDVTTNQSYVNNTFNSIESTPLANGWYKITAIQEIVISGNSLSWGKVLSCRPNVPTTNYQSYTRVPGAGGFFWGHQEERGSFPTSYIPTTFSALTRAADVASITGSDFSSFYNEPASTLYIESPNFPNYGNTSNGSFVYISDVAVLSSTAGDGIKFGTGSPATGTRIFVTEAGATQAQFPVGAGNKFAIAVSENDVSYIIDGASEGTDNTVVVPTGMNRLVMTPHGPGLAHLSRLTYYPYRLPDNTLREITGA